MRATTIPQIDEDGPGREADTLPMRQVSVGIVDRYRTFAQAVAVRLRAEPDIVVPIVTTNSTAFLRAVAEQPLDVVLMDAELDRDSYDDVGCEVLAADIRARWPGTAIVAISDRNDAASAWRMLQLGCLGWVPKDHHIDELLLAVRGAAAGRTYLPPDVLSEVIRGMVTAKPEQRPKQKLDLLTRREAQVLGHLANGLPRAEIARLLDVSPNTVRTHVQRILVKLSVHSTLAAVAVARGAGLFDHSANHVTGLNDVVDLRIRWDHMPGLQT